MGTGQTPERVPAELRPPRPAPRGRAVAGAAEQLAVRVKAAADAADELAACVKPAAVAASQLAARVKAAEDAADQHLMPPRPLAERTPQERDADLMAVAAATPAVPPVAPRSMMPSHRRASGRLPVVPVAALQAPSPGRSDPTPSPVPRVSLVPPTGPLDSPRQLHGASDARNQPTVAARRHADVGPAAAHTVPPMGGAPRRGFLERLAKDLRSSKREVVLGLGIGIGLSFVLVRWGQEFLTHRGAPDAGPSLTVESLAVNPARVPALPLPAAPAVPLPALQLPGAQLPAAQLPGAQLPGAQLPAAQLPTLLRAPSSAAASGRVPSILMESAPLVQASLSGARAASHRRATATHAAKSAKPAPAAPSGSDPGGDGIGDDAPLQAPGEELEPREKAPLSPSQSAGLGLDLPL